MDYPRKPYQTFEDLEWALQGDPVPPTEEELEMWEQESRDYEDYCRAHSAAVLG